MIITLQKSTRLLGVLCYFTSLLYLFELFFPSEILRLIYSLIAAILLTSTLFFLSNVNRLIVLALLGTGMVCFYIESADLQTVILGFGKNINLLSLFLLIPIIGIFMSTAGYLSALKQKVQANQQKKDPHPYRFSFILTATISVLLNFGSMAIVKRIITESFSGYQNKKLSLTIMRAFATSMLWSPYFVNVGLVLILFDLSWFDIGGFGLLLGVVYIIVCVLMFRFISFADDPIIERSTERTEKQTTSLRPFFMFSVVLISLSFILDFLLDVKMLTIVSLLAILLPFLWAFFTRIFKTFVQDVTEQVLHSFERLKNELAVFISAGFLGMAMASTDIGIYLSTLLFQTSLGSVFLLSILLVILATALAQIGIHPVIIVIGIGSALSPSNFGVSPEYLALVLLVAWTVATQISPFSGQVLMASRLMEQPTRIIVKQNFIFICILTLVLTSVIYSFYLLGWL
ncbi:hypothetical protein [Alkalihalobacillus deserti]|uniref:hypothetical protein n=1 Tax=Alkalihalobacillus deserti TaxID=2879466 RepID=UPI001D156DAF|nr:hypothetical protein [Alkalihalobacillus deserti]